MNKGLIAIVVVVIVLILVRVGIGLTAKSSDSDQIKAALRDSIQASKAGKPGGVTDLLGKDLTVNQESASGGIGQVSDFIKRSHPDVTFDRVDPIITGNRAEISSPATLDFSILGQHRTVHLDTVVLVFQKEAATQWFVFPTEKWKLEQVLAPNFSPEQISG
jgi:hypothetical protein